MNAQALSLADLFARADLAAVAPADAAARLITGLAVDSRRLREGEAFLAVPGRATDGRRFIADAVRRGAAVVLVEDFVSADDALAAGTTPIRAVSDLSRLVGRLASAWFHEPSRALRVLGVTGTNGKTSCSHHLAEMLAGLGQRAGICGTLGNGFPGALKDTGLTTADAVTLAGSLAWMRDAGAQWVSMEVSSHALDQERVAGVRFAGALLTNLSRDHLDYHGSMEAYGEAKRQLFLADGLEAAVLNRDDAFALGLPERIPTPVEVFDYSLRDPAASLRVSALSRDAHGSTVRIDSVWGSGEFRTRLLGEFLLSNLLGSLTLLAGLGLPFEDLLAAADVEPVMGRLQPFEHPWGFSLVVDYAHTPAALAQALAVMRSHFSGRVLCVFGCGGERDAGKRPEMAAAAVAGADHVVVTDDNPRGEDGDAIVAQILQGVAAGAAVSVERDRRQAIELACREAREGDVVLVAGKGHENYQDGASGRAHYSDLETVAALVAAAESGLTRGVDAAGA